MAFAPIQARRSLKDVLMSAFMFMGKRYGDYTDDGISVVAGDELNRAIQLANDAVLRTQDAVVRLDGGLDKLTERIMVYIDPPIITGATITATAGSATVALSADVLAATDVDRYIRVDSRWYRISAYANPNITLECKHGGDDVAAGDLEVYTIYHPLAVAGTRMLRMLDKKGGVSIPGVGDLKVKGLDVIRAMDYDLASTGTPSHASFIRYQGKACLMLWPIPTAANNLIIHGVRMPTIMDEDTDYPELPEDFHLLWEAIFTEMLVEEMSGGENLRAAATGKVAAQVANVGVSEDPQVVYYAEYGSGGRGEDAFYYPARSLEINE